ncbi:MAG: hypothetical protein JXA25_16235 [Anaerolineales bacterium]|nr:hypothetical protein [Anaerolineales bacterium]
MRTLMNSLQDEDTGRLHIIAELWGFELPHGSMRELLPIVTARMTDPEIAVEMIQSLPETELQILQQIQANNNRIAVAELKRKFGEIRHLGPGKRDREKPWRNPISPLESLWYRGWISTAFDHTQTGLQEFFYIPNELCHVLPHQEYVEDIIMGTPLEPPESTFPGSTYLLEDCTTLLADIRRQTEKDIPDYLSSSLPDRYLIKPKSKPFLIHVLTELEILSQPGLTPDPQALRAWFETSLPEQWMRCVHCWRDSSIWNDLALVPTLTCPQNNWPNDPLLGRSRILRFLEPIPENTWWDLDTFLNAVKDERPAFQRPAGDFDSWYLQSSANGTFLSGFEAWDAVEGSLIRTLLRGPLYWLGLVDLSISVEGSWITGFRKTSRFNQLFSMETAWIFIPSAAPVFSTSGEILVPLHADPTLRYQIARASVWSGYDGKHHRYYLTPQSLQRSAGQGLSAVQLLAFLKNNGAAPPPYLESAVKNWEQKGNQADVQRVYLLQVADAATLLKLKQDRNTAAFLGKQLNETSILIRKLDLKKLYNAALRSGILLNIPTEDQAAEV